MPINYWQAVQLEHKQDVASPTTAEAVAKGSGIGLSPGNSYGKIKN
jgi:hypothetical protein